MIFFFSPQTSIALKYGLSIINIIVAISFSSEVTFSNVRTKMLTAV